MGDAVEEIRTTQTGSAEKENPSVQFVSSDICIIQKIHVHTANTPYISIECVSHRRFNERRKNAHPAPDARKVRFMVG